MYCPIIWCILPVNNSKIGFKSSLSSKYQSAERVYVDSEFDDEHYLHSNFRMIKRPSQLQEQDAQSKAKERLNF